MPDVELHRWLSTSGSSLRGSLALLVQGLEGFGTALSSRVKKENRPEANGKRLLKGISPSLCFYRDYGGSSSLLPARFQQGSHKRVFSALTNPGTRTAVFP